VRHLASIQTISAVEPIVGADSIELVKVNGWQVVVKIGEFSVGDKIVYFEIDSFIPTQVAPFLTKPEKYPSVFNGVDGERLRTIRLRKTLSQGLVLPVSLFGFENKDVGEDVTEILKIQKYEKPLAACLVGQAKGNFPQFIPKTDQERIQNIVEVLREPDISYEVTLKLDGSSCTVYSMNGEIGVCSRNLELKLNDENSKNAFILASQPIRDVLKTDGRNLAIQGEVLGPKIQGNRENLNSPTFYCFDIWDIDEQSYFTPVERQVYCIMKGVKHAPIINHCEPLGFTNLEEILTYADRPSMVNPIAEGLVFKRSDGKFSFKVISNKFLLKSQD
jgi:RNA ligase (TIGR02306 family)